uniref:Uncharacterized protein n=1 Tax=Picea glauca TaxID=3330 RepID=A0A101M384_PICGL|nr:hypothetical protein ABT39_MTgene3357 [Picea glauca]QHR89121.1 hypothetical protein Q903MT_gene3140 [Picea sitchensis]
MSVSFVYFLHYIVYASSKVFTHILVLFHLFFQVYVTPLWSEGSQSCQTTSLHAPIHVFVVKSSSIEFVSAGVQSLKLQLSVHGQVS